MRSWGSRLTRPAQSSEVNFEIDSGLAQRFAALSAGDSIAIGEQNFAAGLNFLRVWQTFAQSAAAGASLDFFGIAEIPLQDDDLSAQLALRPELGAQADALLACWRRRVPGWNRWHFCDGRVRLTLVISGVEEALEEVRGIDVWLGTGPAQVHAPSLARRTPASALVIGGGIAGCAAAHALALRGIAVTLLERAPTLASAASGNPRGILHARFGAGMNPQQRFVLAAYGHALALLDQTLPVDGVARAECGLLQLGFSEREATRIERLLALDWPPHLLQRVNAAQASTLAGIELQQGGLWFPAGGWVAPPLWCARLADHPGIVQRVARDVEILAATGSGWRVSGHNAQQGVWLADAEIVVVCCAQQALRLQQFAHFPLSAVRGQITELPATPASATLRAVVCADGYVTPAQNGSHLTGATHSLDDESIAVRAADHAENIARLKTHFQELHRALGEIDVAELEGRAAVRCSAPGSMPLVGEVLPHLYCSLAHGTRGLLTAGIAGELIAAAACGQLLPLPTSVIAALDPQMRKQFRNAGG